ncbi:Autophagy protein 12-like [Pseudolycoriella hygida]|uniref:Ubiquitin-like protein ATG12 n=1 Tax=Pseudolycoriella hygida TaxID=35572 RepID=A0A9Q0N0Q3_9DIPT|nr:Autophagy protein 12-like [Pseudolycoriella hygida]
MENPGDDRKETSIERDSSIDTVPDKQSTKIDILLNATGNVPIMKKRKWAVEGNKPISSIMSFIHRYLRMDAEDKLFLYVNQTFAPAPDQIIKNLYDCYGSNGKLVLYYCKSQAWG